MGMESFNMKYFILVFVFFVVLFSSCQTILNFNFVPYLPVDVTQVNKIPVYQSLKSITKYKN